MKHLALALTVFLCFVFRIHEISCNFSNAEIGQIAKLDDQQHFQRVLKEILVPRVVGTNGWKKVQNFIIAEMQAMEMSVELDSFYDTAPKFGKLNFVNIIGRINPKADRFLTLACHYDSKYFERGTFLGATDSAVPCAIMLNIVKTTLPLIQQILAGKNFGLMLIFFDGEEAFESWSASDSLYGSRHLAMQWEHTPWQNQREIDRINVLVLLDLIGASNARFTCTFRNTCSLNQKLRDIENKLRKGRWLSNIISGPSNTFLSTYRSSSVDDDHVPFLQRNVPVLHLIPQNFPQSWHTLNDNEKNLNQRSITNFNKIFRVFVVDYLTTCANNPSSSQCNFQ